MSALALRDFFPGLSGEAIARGLTALPAREGLAGAIDSALEGVLNTSMEGVLFASWKQAREVSDALAKSRRDPRAVAILPLAEHAIAAVHSPDVEVFYGRKRLAGFALRLDLQLTLRGVALEVRGGKLIAVRSGECAGAGSVSLAGETLLERQTPAIPLPGRLAFAARKP
ncbi:MAG TPA: hypothetical protein VF138_09995 [Caulobacteraceae bacterium]